MKKSIVTGIITIFMLFAWSETQAQYALGLSYENRSDEPTNGIGLHFQNDFSPVPLLSLSARLHVSYFNESYNTTFAGAELERKDTSYDIGVTGIAGVNVGIVAPYVGVGIGMEFFNREESIQTPGDGTYSIQEGGDSGFFYYGLVGVGVSAIPLVRPFIEYRYRGITSDDFMPDEYGTLAIGVQLRF